MDFEGKYCDLCVYRMLGCIRNGFMFTDIDTDKNIWFAVCATRIFKKWLRARKIKNSNGDLLQQSDCSLDDRSERGGGPDIARMAAVLRVQPLGGHVGVGADPTRFKRKV